MSNTITTIKNKLRQRFEPVPANVSDSNLAGLLYVRRLKVPELQKYLEAVRAKDGQDLPMLLLAMCVCDKAGTPVFDSPEEAGDLLGADWLTIHDQVTETLFGKMGGPEGNAPAGKTRRNG